MTRPSEDATFRRLAIREPGLLAAVADLDDPAVGLHRLDERTEPLGGRVRSRPSRPFEARVS